MFIRTDRQTKGTQIEDRQTKGRQTEGRQTEDRQTECRQIKGRQRDRQTDGHVYIDCTVVAD